MKKAGFKMFVKKFTACILVAAMTVSTPLTVFAAEFSDFFSISDGSDSSDSETGTVSSTHSGTNTTVLKDNAAKITGFMIYGYDQYDSITMTPGNKKELTAAILTSGSLDNGTTADLNENIRWRSSAASVVSVSAKKGSMNKCMLNAKKAGTATITASLDANRDGKIDENDYMAVVNVEVIEPSQGEIRWNITDTFYVKHTYRLSDYLWINDRQLGDATTDVVTFAVKGSSKVATISGDMLTVKGAGDITLSVVLPDGTEGPKVDITTSVGKPIKKMTASTSKVELDFNQDGKAISDPSEKVSVDIITTDGDTDNTTDLIIWSTNNASVATVEADPTDPDNQTKAVITATDGIGKATITAKSTSGKTAKFSVVVKATLISIDGVSIDGDCAWSGKTEELIIERTPVQNRDKFKITSDNKLVKVKSTANNATITPANDLKLTDGEEGIEVTLTVESNDKYSDAEPKEAKITVLQSDVEIKNVTYEANGDPESLISMHKKTVRTNPGETYDYGLDLNEKRPIPGNGAVSWVSSNVKVATIDNDGHLAVVGQGTAKITVSSIYKNNKNKYTQSKKTFTIKSTPVCTGIEFKSDTAAYDLSKKKSVTINIKQQLPKKANDEIEWYVNGIKQAASKNVTDKKITILPSNAAFSGASQGATVEVMARSKMDPSVYSVATIYVVKPAAKKVAFSTKYKKGITLQVGATNPNIEAPTVTGSSSDPIVRYTVDKKGVGVVKAEMAEDGKLKLTGVGEGKATVTAYTASGKKGTLKVTVK